MDQDLMSSRTGKARSTPHKATCACMQCYYRARRAARAGGEQGFPAIAAWRAAQTRRQASAAPLERLDQDDLMPGKGGKPATSAQAPSGASPSTSRVVTRPGGGRLFVAGEKNVQVDTEAEAEALRLATDPCAWIDQNIRVSELGKVFKLAPYQRRVLAAMFQFDQDGKLWIDEALWSEIKKSGKTTIAGILGLWWGDCHEAPNEILVVANDLEQAASRAFATMATLLTRNPELGKRAKRVSNTLIRFTTGTTIRAIASEFAGAAGSNHGLVLWDETWAGTTESYRRLWDELTPVPTRLNSVRLIFSYAGFEGESKTLRDLYLAGVDAEEHPEGRGERIDADLPLYRSRAGGGLNLVTFWSHECRMPWQTPAWLERQRQDHISKGRVSTWLRLFENRWVSGESMFITAALWDAIVDPTLTPAAPNKNIKVWVGVDVGIKNDTTGIVAVTKRTAPDGTARFVLVSHKIFKPKPGTPVDHANIAAVLRWLHASFAVQKIAVDPSQALEMISYLKREGLRVEEVPQTSGTVDEMGQTLITCIQAKTLVVYPDADLRQQALNTVAVEKPNGMRMDKAKSNRKIDAIVALAMALRGLAIKPESFHLPLSTQTKDWTKPAAGRVVDAAGTRYLGDGRFRTASGEDWRDPRY